MTIHIHPAVIQKHPHYPRWQALIRSHPDGVAGVPLVVGDFPQKLVLIDCAGHKLVFPVVDVEALPAGEDNIESSQKPQPGRRAGR
jgi:hypothetical protein